MVYIQLKNQIVKTSTKEIYLLDICNIISDKSISNIKIGEFQKNKSFYALNAVQLIAILRKEVEGENFVFIGDTTVCVEFVTNEKPNKLVENLKVLIISSIIFAGASTALMAFQVESNIDKMVFEYAKIFGVDENTSKLAFSIPYPIGIALGIIVFFNHFGNKKLNEDPTPIEIEMDEFDEKLKNNLVEKILSSEKGSEKN